MHDKPYELLTCAIDCMGKLQLCCPALFNVPAYGHFILVYIQVSVNFSTPTV